jgi:hypothetical protein
MKYLKATVLLIFIVLILVKSYKFGYKWSKKAFSRIEKTRKI